MALSTLGADGLAVGWIRRFLDGAEDTFFVRRVDPVATGIDPGPEVEVPTVNYPTNWVDTSDDARQRIGPLPGEGILFVAWVERGTAPDALVATHQTDGVVDIVWTLPGYTPGRFPGTEAFASNVLFWFPSRASLTKRLDNSWTILEQRFPLWA